MNVVEYIASGILESYVMGAVSNQEQREVDCLSAIYPEIRQELNALQESLEEYALLYSVEPPTGTREKIMARLTFAEPREHEAVVRPLPVDRSSGPTFQTTWIVAASVGLLVLVFSYFLLAQLRTNQETLASLRSANGTLLGEVRQLRHRQTLNEERLAVLQKAGTRVIELRGNQKAPNGDVLVYWNKHTRQISVDIKSLPPLPADQQYQLWSLVGGKPIDAGVFEADTSARPLQRLNRLVDAADAFAVTVEKRGGSPTPTLSTLLAMTPVDA